MNIVTPEGYTVTGVGAWVVRCRRCGEPHLVLGIGADVDAAAWTKEHDLKHEGKS